jgi:hypothetical protein
MNCKKQARLTQLKSLLHTVWNACRSECHTAQHDKLGRRLTHWTASVVAILLASCPCVASAQVNCDAIPHGPARTDCYLGLSQFYRAQSDLAAAGARAQSDAAWYRAITGTDPPKHRPRRRK